LPQLTAGNGVCNGSNWEISFSETTGATVFASSGTISGNKVIDIPVGTNVTISAINGTCNTNVNVTSPTSCSSTSCDKPLISLGGSKCNPNGTKMYTAYFTKTSSSVVVTSTLGTVSGDSIINIPSDSSVVITASLTGCSNSTKVTMPSQVCLACVSPILTVGSASCAGTSYEISFTSNATSGVTTSAGTISGNKIINVPKNTNVTITASNAASCATVSKVATPNADCPSTASCVTPKLVVGNSICNGTDWEFSFVETTGASVLVSSGTISGNKVTGISVGTNVTITAVNGTCASNITINSPSTCSGNACEKPLISFGGTRCNTSGTKTYTAFFTRSSSSVVVSSTAGTVTAGDSIINIPNDSLPTITASLSGCTTIAKVKLTPNECNTCIVPILTVSNATCSGSSYEITFTTNASNGVQASAGTVSGNKVINIPKNSTVTITASNVTGCSTVSKVTTPNFDCPNTSSCVTPKISIGNGVCNGTEWELSFVETTGATIFASSGTVVGNKITGLTVGSSVTITAVNGTCVANITINSPASCTGNACDKPLISLGGTRCNTSGVKTYTAFFTRSSSSVVVTSTAGTVTAGDSIINIPNDSLPTITATLSGCATATKVKLSANECNACVAPVLTVSNASCNGSSYEFTFNTNSTSVTSSAGTVSGSKVINAPKNTSITISATNGSCITTAKVLTPNSDCPSSASCVTPVLTVGNGICNGTNWEFSFVETTGATIVPSSGTISGNKVTGIPVGTDVTLTAVNGSCVSSVVAVSPSSCSGNTCDKPLISLGGTKCSPDGTKTYIAYLIKSSSNVVITSTLGTVSGDSIINIPSDSTPIVTATLTGCSIATVIKLPSKVCATCVAPVLTLGSASCGGSSYEVTFSTNAVGGVTTSAGTVSGDKIIGIPKNTIVTVTASNGTGCATIIKVTTPNEDCPNAPTTCVTPKLTAGNGVCNGTTWDFSFTETTGAVISVSAGTISGNKVTGIPVGTNVNIIASNNPTCVVSLNINSPNCSSPDPCDKQLVSIGGTKCNSNGNTYTIYFTKASSSVVVTSKFGTVSGDSIINVPIGKVDTITATITGCSKKIAIPVKASACVGFVVNIDNSKVSKGGTSNINVASNDNLTASANYKFKVSSNPKKGTVVIDSVTGIATYKSTDTSFVGLDSFSYSVTDPVTGEVKTTLVYVTIGNPNNVNVVTPEGNGTGVDGEDIFDGNNSIRTKNYNLEALPSNGTVSDFDPATGAFKYTPTPGKCGNDSARVRVIYTYNENGKTPDTFYYMVRMNIPCSSNDIPNYITPNGDGINDAFVIPNFATKYRNAKLIIYNRWGNIVWRSYGSYENNWTGTHYDGLPLPDGVYYYMIENKDDKVLVQPVTGFIQIGRD
jgi:gliding motility-associated-like protein